MTKYSMKKLITISLISIISIGVSAQENHTNDDDYFYENYLRYENYIYKENIKTILFHKQGWELTYPIINLNSEDKLKLSFDDLDGDIKDYYYTIIHCDANWQPSDLLPADYIEGFIENQIQDYKYSFNTLYRYIHYNLIIPNENIQPKISGNYILKVYEDYDETNLVLTKRFVIVEHKVTISANVKRATLLDLRKSSHEIDFTLSYSAYSINNPYRDIKVVIAQNNRWDNVITNLKPLFVKYNELVYDYEEDNVFSGGSEYRYFDIKSVRYQSDRIWKIHYEKPYYHIYLFNDEKRTFKIYYFYQDLNGKCFIKVQEGEDSEVEADYVYVHFTLPYDSPIIDGNIYVFGGLSDWSFNTNNQMKYNFDKKAYELTLLLKQGYYNYEYVHLKDGSKVADNTFIEGSHYETENDYIIYVYHRDVNSRYDKLIGFEIVNSLRE